MTNGEVKKDNTLMLVLSYLGILCLIPLLTEKNDPDVQWHAKHGLVLLIAEVILYVALGIVSLVLGKIPVLGFVFGIFGCLLWSVLPLGILVLHIICIVKAVKGERLIIPYVTEYVNRF